MKKIQENNYIEWDLKTITSADYTIEFDLDPLFFQTWVEKESHQWLQKQHTFYKQKVFKGGASIEVHDEQSKEYTSKVEAFRDWITYEMEQRLDELPDLGFEDEPVEHVKVALTTFAFKNADIINLLKKRGDAVKNEKWDELQKIEA